MPACSSGTLTNVLPHRTGMTADTEHDTPTPSQYTDTGHDTPTPSQYTDTGHDTPPSHSIQTQDMTPYPVTVYRHRT